mmetsp:Transcript_14874/g.26966  ORF Transcript_14874/g.26966 Transcript_14874/m.26966 type:complete len:445 (-) Transcript_14874:531-1865(-)|eukprot:CAMPEP_0198304752 /NCGR_PEP_ID=MMETSP1449-20131203/57562_1 /TAXON_ID=420275 /ORGANISM="Attheya septentrionalis, Strain CCMP2084" /LENGTH=444 /DNA_ID=CAMNT_0044007281 /DNA_START=162 /DNA_END=1496 /DNA_ORIENTATION=+
MSVSTMTSWRSERFRRTLFIFLVVSCTLAQAWTTPAMSLSVRVSSHRRTMLMKASKGLSSRRALSAGSMDLDDSNSNVGSDAAPSTECESNSLDRVLSKLTSAFPLFVVLSAVLGIKIPASLEWVNQGSLISVMLASVMMGTGMTLEKKDFTNVLSQNFAAVPAGVLCQFSIMPLAAYAIGKTFLLPADPVLGPALFLGLTLVGCSPGGTASNLVSLIAGADVALSVLLTACSTVLASGVTPLLTKTLVGSAVTISGRALCAATAKVVLLPVALGMLLNAKAPKLSQWAARFTPFCSVLLVALICGGVVAQNASAVLIQGPLLRTIVCSVLGLHSLGFLMGFILPRFGLKLGERTSRTIAIETGMQNSALAVVLARSIGAHPLASLPGALSATVHSCLGSILAAYWRFLDSRPARDEKTPKGPDFYKIGPPPPEDEQDTVGYSI